LLFWSALRQLSVNDEATIDVLSNRDRVIIIQAEE
jgi:hypothetical protein